LTENVPIVEDLLYEGCSDALAAELFLADTQIATAGNVSRTWVFGGMRSCERRSRAIDDVAGKLKPYLAISQHSFGSCGETFVSCVPAIGDVPLCAAPVLVQRVLDALRQLLDECRANGSKLCIFIPAPGW